MGDVWDKISFQLMAVGGVFNNQSLFVENYRVVFKNMHRFLNN